MPLGGSPKCMSCGADNDCAPLRAWGAEDTMDAPAQEEGEAGEVAGWLSMGRREKKLKTRHLCLA